MEISTDGASTSGVPDEIPSTSGASDADSQPPTAPSASAITSSSSEASSGQHDVAELLSPVKASASRKRSRQAQRAEVITSSPYKKRMMDKAEEKKNKQQKKQNAEKQPKQKKKTQAQKRRHEEAPGEQPSTSSQEVPCFVCGMLFRRSCEQWIQCTVCKLWACVPCTDSDKKQASYVCDLCR